MRAIKFGSSSESEYALERSSAVVVQGRGRVGGVGGVGKAAADSFYNLQNGLGNGSPHSSVSIHK